MKFRLEEYVDTYRPETFEQFTPVCLFFADKFRFDNADLILFFGLDSGKSNMLIFSMICLLINDNWTDAFSLY